MAVSPKPRVWRARDTCVVHTEVLACLVESFIIKKGASCDQHPVTWLMERSRDGDPKGRGISFGKITQVLQREREFTDLSVADALLVAMGEMEALYDGTIEIFPNPARPGCCAVYRPSFIAVALASWD